jgi:hypothetical protein
MCSDSACAGGAGRVCNHRPVRVLSSRGGAARAWPTRGRSHRRAQQTTSARQAALRRPSADRQGGRVRRACQGCTLLPAHKHNRQHATQACRRRARTSRSASVRARLWPSCASSSAASAAPCAALARSPSAASRAAAARSPSSDATCGRRAPLLLCSPTLFRALASVGRRPWAGARRRRRQPCARACQELLVPARFSACGGGCSRALGNQTRPPSCSMLSLGYKDEPVPDLACCMQGPRMDAASSPVPWQPRSSLLISSRRVASCL